MWETMNESSGGGRGDDTEGGERVAVQPAAARADRPADFSCGVREHAICAVHSASRRSVQHHGAVPCSPTRGSLQ